MKQVTFFIIIIFMIFLIMFSSINKQKDPWLTTYFINVKNNPNRGKKKSQGADPALKILPYIRVVPELSLSSINGPTTGRNQKHKCCKNLFVVQYLRVRKLYAVCLKVVCSVPKSPTVGFLKPTHPISPHFSNIKDTVQFHLHGKTSIAFLLTLGMTSPMPHPRL